MITDISITLGQPQTTFDLRWNADKSLTITITQVKRERKSKDAPLSTVTLTQNEAGFPSGAMEDITAGNNV